MKRLYSILLVIVTVYGCEKDDLVQYSSSLIGEWSWLISCGGVVGCVRPSANNTCSLLFTIDSILYLYRNDTLYSSWVFQTFNRLTNNGLDTIKILTYGSSIQEYSINHDILRLFNPDWRFGSEYKRIKQEHFP